METRTILVLLGLLAVPCALADEAYVWTDEEGVVHYSDRPHPGAKRVELQAPNTSQSPAPRRSTVDSARRDDAAEPAPTFSYESLEFTSPEPEETLWNIEGRLNVRLALTPALQQGHQIRVLFDGNPTIVNTTSFRIEEVWRGAHSLQAEVLDEAGNMMIRSSLNRFYVQQSTVF
ncbi:MAG: DUF4124 domain-containing protein [Woeseiaceae bacterium]|nr:DUF4124 domain-containing protein [Woeseiaceae bacterium]